MTRPRDYLATVSEPSIRAVQVPAAPRPRLGALRNLSLQASRGDYVAQWDDDDWHGPTRLAEQIEAIRTSGKPACVLSRWLVFNAPTRTAFLPDRRAWEGSLVAARTAVPPYADVSRGEDTPVVQRLLAEDKLVLLDRPELYVYVQHGSNTWGLLHWLTNVLAPAQPLGPEEAERLRRLLAADGS